MSWLREVAREAAGNRAFVAGAIGPLGLRIEPYGPTSFDEAKDMFKAQVSQRLLEGGVDLFVSRNVFGCFRNASGHSVLCGSYAICRSSRR